MKISKNIYVACFFLAIFICGLGLFSVSAQGTPMTSDQVQRISNNCVSAKSTLNQLHASDALLRVNRGQIYESMLTKLMNRFNERVANNNFDNSSLVSVATDYSHVLDSFRLDYKSYEEQLSVALGIDCSKQPVAFYDAVVLARTKRDQVHSDVTKLGQYINQYQLTVDQFEKDYKTAVEGITR